MMVKYCTFVHLTRPDKVNMGGIGVVAEGDRGKMKHE